MTPDKTNCQHEVELIFSGGSDTNPLPVCKKCGAIIYSSDKTNWELDMHLKIMRYNENPSSQTREAIVDEFKGILAQAIAAAEKKAVREFVEKLKHMRVDVILASTGVDHFEAVDVEDIDSLTQDQTKEKDD